MKRSFKLKTLAVGASCLALVVTASAAPIASFTYGGHTFNLYAAPGATWAADEAAANANGQYLAILPNAATITAVYNGLINNGFFVSGGPGSQAAEAYIGAVPADGSYSTTDPNNWSWVTSVPPPGPVASVVPWTVGWNFNAGEPNGDSLGLAINRYGVSTFNDEGSFTGGYITETVPDGGLTIAMFAMGVSGLALIRRKFQG